MKKVIYNQINKPLNLSPGEYEAEIESTEYDKKGNLIINFQINTPKKLYLCALCDGIPCHKDCEDCNK